MEFNINYAMFLKPFNVILNDRNAIFYNFFFIQSHYLEFFAINIGADMLLNVNTKN